MQNSVSVTVVRNTSRGVGGDTSVSFDNRIVGDLVPGGVQVPGGVVYPRSEVMAVSATLASLGFKVSLPANL